MDGTYAPQSPDLSGFQSSPSKQQQLYQPIPSQQPLSHPQQQIPSYAPRSPIIPSFAPQYTTNAYQEQSLDLSPHQPHPHQGTQYNLSPSEFSEYGTTSQYMPAIPALPASHSFNAPPTSTPSYYNPPIPNQEQQYNPFDGTSEYIQSHNNPPKMTSRGRPRVKAEESLDFSSAPQHQHQPPHQQQQQQIYKNPNPLNIEIRTKFPVARIKRIMQADEEVGKVAQVTPVAVNKALELFMIALVTGAADKAREKGGKRVTAQHLKSVVEGDETFDFLKDIVERVADVQENAGGEGRKRKPKVEGSDSEVEEKPKKGKGRRKKSEE